MKNALRDQKKSSAFTALVTIAIGAVLMLKPGDSVTVLCRLLGGGVFLFGLIYVLSWFFNKRRGGFSSLLVIPGVVLAGLGVWLMISADTVIALIQYVFGAVIIFHGVLDLMGAASLVRHRAPRWWLDVLLAMLTLALGLLILANPFGAFSTLVTLIGIALIYDGLTDLWLIFRLSRTMKALQQAQAGIVAETEGRDVTEEAEEEKAEETEGP